VRLLDLAIGSQFGRIVQLALMGLQGAMKQNSGTASGCSGMTAAGQPAPCGWASTANRATLSAMAWHAPMSAIATLAELRRCTPWLWIHCEYCQHRSPAAIVPLMIRWGADASSDMLRRSQSGLSAPPVEPG